MIKVPILVNIFLEKECFFTGIANVNRTEVEKNPNLSHILQSHKKNLTQNNRSLGNAVEQNKKLEANSKKAGVTVNNSKGKKAGKEKQVDRSVSASKNSKNDKKGGKSGGKQKSQEKSQNENDFQDEMQVEGQQEFQNDFDDQNQNENQQEKIMDQEQNEAELQERMLQEMQMQEEIEDSLGDSISQEDDDLSLSNINNFTNLTKYKTKRQRGDYQDFRELPDKKPRKKKNQADDIVRRQEKQKKRKQYLKKQLQAQQKATLDKLLHETGRQLRLREQKQVRNQIKRENRKHNTLGDVPKIVTKNNESGNQVMIHKTSLFSPEMTQKPDTKMKELCSICTHVGKYKLKIRNCSKLQYAMVHRLSQIPQICPSGLELNCYACSLDCYKRLVK